MRLNPLPYSRRLVRSLLLRSAQRAVLIWSEPTTTFRSSTTPTSSDRDKEVIEGWYVCSSCSSPSSEEQDVVLLYEFETEDTTGAGQHGYWKPKLAALCETCLHDVRRGRVPTQRPDGATHSGKETVGFKPHQIQGAHTEDFEECE